jgi:hypothetical protein
MPDNPITLADLNKAKNTGYDKEKPKPKENKK